MSSTVVQSDFGPAVREGNAPRTIAYWGATGVVTIVPLLAAFAYLTTSPEAVENFRHVGYPQQLRVLLGVAKLAGRGRAVAARRAAGRFGRRVARSGRVRSRHDPAEARVGAGHSAAAGRVHGRARPMPWPNSLPGRSWPQ